MSSETVRPAAEPVGADEAADARAWAEDRDPPATALHRVRRVTPLGIGAGGSGWTSPAARWR